MTITKSSCWTTTRPIPRCGGRWKRIARRWAPRFRFFHFDGVKGFKAGALNRALALTDPDATHIAVIDSDYQVEPFWLRRAMPYFASPGIALVQGPQDYRDAAENLFKAMAYEEYRGFFHIGMVERNEHNAIIQHGTMTIVAKAALEEVDGWSEWCITEDTELGLKLFEAGYEAAYIPQSMGAGSGARHAGSLHVPALSLGLWRHADA